MIVVRANDDVLVGFSGKVGEDVVHRRARRLNLQIERNGLRCRERHRVRLIGRVNSRLHVCERFSRPYEPRCSGFVRDLHDGNAHVFRTRDAAERGEQILFAGRELAVDQNRGGGSVVPRVDGFGDDVRVARRCVRAQAAR